MSLMSRTVPVLLAAAVLALAGCGSDPVDLDAEVDALCLESKLGYSDLEIGSAHEHLTVEQFEQVLDRAVEQCPDDLTR